MDAFVCSTENFKYLIEKKNTLQQHYKIYLKDLIQSITTFWYWNQKNRDSAQVLKCWYLTNYLIVFRKQKLTALNQIGVNFIKVCPKERYSGHY